MESLVVHGRGCWCLVVLGGAWWWLVVSGGVWRSGTVKYHQAQPFRSRGLAHPLPIANPASCRHVDLKIKALKQDSHSIFTFEWEPTFGLCCQRSPGAWWCRVVPGGDWWWLMVPGCAWWCLLVPGHTWRWLLVPGRSRTCLVVPGRAWWWLLVRHARPVARHDQAPATTTMHHQALPCTNRHHPAPTGTSNRKAPAIIRHHEPPPVSTWHHQAFRQARNRARVFTTDRTGTPSDMRPSEWVHPNNHSLSKSFRHCCNETAIKGVIQ